MHINTSYNKSLLCELCRRLCDVTGERMRNSITLGLISSLLFIGTSSAEVYVGTDRLFGSVTASPQGGGGGDTFKLPVDFTLSIKVDIVPFQSMTIKDLTLTADPVALDFPGFNGNVTLTVDELSLQWTDREFDLNPASGGVFETPPVYGPLNGCTSTWSCDLPAGRVDLRGKWDNYAFHEDLADVQNVARYYRSSNDYDMQIDPGNYPENLELGFYYYDPYDSYGSRHSSYKMFEANLSDVLLEPNYEWSEIAIYYPNVSGHDGSTYYNLTLSPEVVPLLGDFNDSGTVDAADYTVWKDNLGGDASVLHGNGVTTTTAVSGADYALWKNHFGESNASGSSESVPEPTAAILVLIMCVGCFRSRL